MCGRFALTEALDRLAEHLALVHPGEFDVEMPPRYNIAPTQPIFVATNNTMGQRQGLLVRWGLVPAWVKDPNDFTLLINARSETAIEKPSFKTAMRHRRILIPASGFYEWQRFGGKRKSQPWWVRPADGGIVAFGGLMETWAGADGTEIDTACILSTEANESFAPIHNRLPLVIPHKDFDRWLDCKTQEPRDVVDIMQPAPDNYFEAIPVSDAVNKVANGDASIQQRVEPEEPLPAAPNDQMSLF